MRDQKRATVRRVVTFSLAALSILIVLQPSQTVAVTALTGVALRPGLDGIRDQSASDNVWTSSDDSAGLLVSGVDGTHTSDLARPDLTIENNSSLCWQTVSSTFSSLTLANGSRLPDGTGLLLPDETLTFVPQGTKGTEPQVGSTTIVLDQATAQCEMFDILDVIATALVADHEDVKRLFHNNAKDIIALSALLTFDAAHKALADIDYILKHPSENLVISATKVYDLGQQIKQFAGKAGDALLKKLALLFQTKVKLKSTTVATFRTALKRLETILAIKDIIIQITDQLVAAGKVYITNAPISVIFSYGPLPPAQIPGPGGALPGSGVDNQDNWQMSWCEVTGQGTNGGIARLSGSTTCTDQGDPVAGVPQQQADSSAPSGDGNVLVLTHEGGTGYANIQYNAVVNDGPSIEQGLHLTADFDVKIVTPNGQPLQGWSSPAEAVEFGLTDWNPSFDPTNSGTWYEMTWLVHFVGLTPDFVPNWQVLDGTQPGWLDTGLSYGLTANTWHHLHLAGSMEGSTIMYQSLSVDGQQVTINKSVGTVLRYGYDPNLRMYVQLDGSRGGDTYAVWLDNVDIHWSS